MLQDEVGRTSISVVILLIRTGLGVLEVLILDLCESNHLGGCCGKSWKKREI